MRVLAHICTYNAANVIDRTIDAVRRQTRSVDEILIVDNASADDTLERPSIKHTTVLRQPENRGSSGAVYSGISYALEQGYDWIWVFDHDSVPASDALEKLLDLYAGFSPTLQEKTAFLACLPCNIDDGKFHHGAVFTRHLLLPVKPVPESCYYPCDVAIWSGTLFRLAAVRRIGLPQSDYCLDGGDIEYGYRVMKAGYTGFTHRDALLQHNIGGTSETRRNAKFGPINVPFYEFPPIRCYYLCRNTLYFVLHDSAEKRFGLLLGVGLRLFHVTASFLLRPRTHQEHILASLRGVWHGITGNIAARY
jgi:rhamnosyltransferase